MGSRWFNPKGVMHTTMVLFLIVLFQLTSSPLLSPSGLFPAASGRQPWPATPSLRCACSQTGRFWWVEVFSA